jgi:mRNA-degrading endonuclease RelE of RelBE toxin-antitoxin system
MKVRVHSTARKYIDSLNEPDKGRVLSALKKLSYDPPEGDIEYLSGRKGFRRLKTGGYRILFKKETVMADNTEEEQLAVTHIDLRGQAYGRKNKSKRS